MNITHDEIGPEKIINVYHPKTGMKGVVVIDNTALGPGKGGIRMTPTVDTEEVADSDTDGCPEQHGGYSPEEHLTCSIIV